MQYLFSAPMPYYKEHIDTLSEINKKIKKSKITSLYFSLPYNCDYFSGFEQSRNCFPETDFEYWKELIKYSIDEGFDFVYTFNLPNPTIYYESDIKEKLDKLDFLLKELDQLGCKKLRISNFKLLSYIEEKHPQFELYASTSFEFKTIKEYQNFLYLHPNIKQIVISHDLNKNFKFLKNIKEQYKDLEIELIINEGCMGGCPLRKEHSSYIRNKDVEKFSNAIFSPSYYITQCSKIIDTEFWSQIFRTNIIYPWELEHYKKIGIINFKLVGRDYYSRFSSGNTFDDYFIYLSGIDDIKNINNKAFKVLHHRFRQSPELNVYIKDIKPYLPKIEFFEKKGHLCASDCGIKCQYCMKCAEKFQKNVPIQKGIN